MKKMETYNDLALKEIANAKEALNKMESLLKQGDIVSIAQAVTVGEGIEKHAIVDILKDILFKDLQHELGSKGYNVQRFNEFGHENYEWDVVYEDQIVGKASQQTATIFVVNPEMEIEWRERVLNSVHREDYVEDITRMHKLKPIIEKFKEDLESLGLKHIQE